jgi:hypothetical protein
MTRYYVSDGENDDIMRQSPVTVPADKSKTVPVVSVTDVDDDSEQHSVVSAPVVTPAVLKSSVAHAKSPDIKTSPTLMSSVSTSARTALLDASQKLATLFTQRGVHALHDADNDNDDDDDDGAGDHDGDGKAAASTTVAKQLLVCADCGVVVYGDVDCVTQRAVRHELQSRRRTTHASEPTPTTTTSQLLAAPAAALQSVSSICSVSVHA